MATELDVEFRLDETLTINAEVKDPDGEAMNLTGLVTNDIRWGISDSKGGTRLATLAIGTGITVVSAAAGTIKIEFAPSSQDAIHPGRYYHECQVVHSSHGTSIQFAGKARVLESVFMTEA
jgi:hypothetical protein